MGLLSDEVRQLAAELAEAREEIKNRSPLVAHWYDRATKAEAERDHQEGEHHKWARKYGKIAEELQKAEAERDEALRYADEWSTAKTKAVAERDEAREEGSYQHVLEVEAEATRLRDLVEGARKFVKDARYKYVAQRFAADAEDAQQWLDLTAEYQRARGKEGGE